MNDEYFRMFSQILDKSIEKHGNADKPITIGHLSNMAKLAIKIVDDKEARNEAQLQASLDEIWHDHHKYGTND